MSNSLNTKNQEYYEICAEDYFKQTVAIEMGQLHEQFLNLIPAAGQILDAGCGSGRDAKIFLDQGFSVKAFDSSATLSALASAHLGQEVDVLRFQDLAIASEYDGIWACASLLHVPVQNMRDVFLRLSQAIRSGGVLYASFKYGSGERMIKGRRFTNMNETELALLLNSEAGFKELKTWVSDDLRPGRENEKWLNTLLQKEEG